MLAMGLDTAISLSYQAYSALCASPKIFGFSMHATHFLAPALSDK